MIKARKRILPRVCMCPRYTWVFSHMTAVGYKLFFSLVVLL